MASRHAESLRFTNKDTRFKNYINLYQICTLKTNPNDCIQDIYS